MTHNVNYGHDRLGNYVFSKLIYQISTWTRLQFSPGVASRQLARTYFEDYYPEEQMPVFTVSLRRCRNMNDARPLCRIRAMIVF